ncbi:hypothetical protein [Holospora curviuscula]|uniref:Uncharacterized protein n=1 Tax=Holospora curviuscula TaxID=1082868 RepID=A0A2S5RHT4_9PROT|nr:hypothetical protein [Holospora curviuscula]PPE06881.1 hypothetical protein HCUR_00094 [Holospora curviuscula]
MNFQVYYGILQAGLDQIKVSLDITEAFLHTPTGQDILQKVDLLIRSTIQTLKELHTIFCDEMMPESGSIARGRTMRAAEKMNFEDNFNHMQERIDERSDTFLRQRQQIEEITRLCDSNYQKYVQYFQQWITEEDFKSRVALEAATRRATELKQEELEKVEAVKQEELEKVKEVKKEESESEQKSPSEKSFSEFKQKSFQLDQFLDGQNQQVHAFLGMLTKERARNFAGFQNITNYMLGDDSADNNYVPDVINSAYPEVLPFLTALRNNKNIAIQVVNFIKSKAESEI